MNFKDWVKLEEDDKTCTLQHPKGHVMKIAMKALPRIHREQIKRLAFAKGGKIESEDALDSGDQQGISTQGEAVRSSHAARHDKRYPDEHTANVMSKHAKAEAKGRAEFERVASKPNIKGLAEGGEVRKSKHFWESEEGKQALAEQNKEVKNIRDSGERAYGKKGTHEIDKSGNVKRKNYDEGGDVKADDPQPDAAPTPQAPQTIINVGAPTPPSTQGSQAVPPPSPAPMPPASPAAEFAKQPVQVEQPAIPQGRSNLNSDGTMNPSAAAENAQAANQGQANIDAAKTEAMKPVVAGYQQGTAETEQIANQRLADYTKHVNDAAAAINKGLINPKNYQESMGSGAKVSNAIGLFFGGLGTPFGGHNFAMDFLNKQIDRDIDAQKTRSEQQKTILGAYEHLYGQGVAATAATKATLLDAYKNKADQIAMQLGTPQAAQRALQLGSQIAIEKSKALQEGAVNLNSLPGNHPAMNGSAGSGKLRRPGAPMGSPPGEGTAPDKTAAAAPVGPLHETILNPKAEAKFRSLQYAPKARDQWPEITRQYTQAQQADKALNDVNQTYMRLIKGSEEGGMLGRAHRTFDPSMVGGLGDNLISGAANLIGHGAAAATNNDVNRRYDSDKSAMLGYISAALKGTNIGSGQIEDIVSKNSPEYGDEPKTTARKLKTIRDFIKNHTETSLLKTWGLTRD